MPSGELDDWPVGLALVDDDGRVLEINSTGAAILQSQEEGCRALEELLLAQRAVAGPLGSAAAGGSPGPEEPANPAAGLGWHSGWIEAAGAPLELAYRLRSAEGATAVVFYDVTARRQRERRAAAVARTAARVASERSLPATLNALAHEILQADGMAGVQVLTKEPLGEKLHMLGMAGFPASRTSAFFSLLMECRRRGADLRMLDAFESASPVVIAHRYAAVMANPAWEPLHEFHRHPEWDAFASLPIQLRRNTIGILNVFLKPGREIDDETLEFLASMADQAALAIDYASLLEDERHAAHREERQRLARDLHDSVVQQVFSMGMLARTLRILAEGPADPDDERIGTITAELEEITGSVSQDLRRLVAQLRPSAVEGVGLRGALSKLTAATHRQTGVKFELHLSSELEQVDEELGEDLYHVAAEAVHNAVKHSPADLIDISALVADGRIQLAVRDNGGGQTAEDAAVVEREGHGLSFMRQRIRRWNGSFSVRPNFGGVGTVVRADVPYLASTRFQGGNQ